MAVDQVQHAVGVRRYAALFECVTVVAPTITWAYLGMPTVKWKLVNPGRELTEVPF